MNLSRWKRKWYGRATLAVAALSLAGLMLQNVGRAGAASIPDVNNAGVFELDGNVAQDTTPPPPNDWASLFTPVNTPVGAIPVSTPPASLVDSAFAADTNGTDSAFVTGSSKDGLDTTGWQCVTKSTPPKDEIQNAYGAAFIAPSTSPVAGHVLLYLALERGSINGTSNAGFWLFKQPTACDPTTGTFVNTRTNPPTPAAHSDGDILLFASFTSGGAAASVSEFLWSAACTTTNQAGCISTSPTGGLTTANASGVDCAVSTTNLCGAFNGTGSITTPWAPGSVGTNGFFEVGMDLTALIPNDLASSCFSTFLADTRSSASVTADLHDFISGSFSLCRPTTLTTTQTPTPPATLTVNSGTTTDTATLHSFTGSVTGEPVNFTLFGPFTQPQTSFDCTATSAVPSVFKGSSNLDAGGTTSSAVSTGPLTTVGTYYWVAYYGGDRASGGLNLPSQSGCVDEPVTVIKASPTIATTAGTETPSPGIVGSPVTTSDTATLTGAFQPTGTVTFELLTSACDATKPLKTVTTTTISAGSGGTFTATTGSVSFTPTTVDTYYWVASYGGDSNNNPAPPTGFSTCPDSNEAVPVVKATPTVNTIMFLGDIANISAGFNPTGTITFQLFNNTTCTAPAVYSLANVPLSNLSANTLADLSTHLANAELKDGNTYSWQVTYNGDANNNSVTVGCGTVSPASSSGSTATEATGTITQH
jgi:hypothetical protein